MFIAAVLGIPISVDFKTCGEHSHDRGLPMKNRGSSYRGLYMRNRGSGAV